MKDKKERKGKTKTQLKHSQDRCHKMKVKKVTSLAKKARVKRKALLVETGLIKCKLETKVHAPNSLITSPMIVLFKGQNN
jgi:hypothetical protein